MVYAEQATNRYAADLYGTNVSQNIFLFLPKPFWSTAETQLCLNSATVYLFCVSICKNRVTRRTSSLKVMYTFTFALRTNMHFFSVEHVSDNTRQWTGEEKPAANRAPTKMRFL